MALPVFAPQMLRKDMRGELIEAEMGPRRPYLYEKYATIIPSSSNRENLAWLSEAADMEKHEGTMPIHTLTDTGETAATGAKGPGYEVTINTYAGALVFRRDDMSDEMVGGYRQRITDQVTLAQSFPDRELITNLVNGETYTCYLQNGATQEAFFSATHAARGKQTATWSNLLTGTGTDVSNLQADINSAVAAFFKMRGENNVLMNEHLRQFFILCPAALKAKMRTAVYSAVVSQTSNVEQTDLDIVVEPVPLLDATDANDWYLGSYDPGYIRGLVWVDREGVMSEEIGPGSEMWTNLRQMEFAVTRRGAPAFGKPQRLLKMSNT